VEETLHLGVKIREVAHRHGLYAQRRITRRGLAQEGRLGDTSAAFVPVEITTVPV
jgi:hypothetical protein